MLREMYCQKTVIRVSGMKSKRMIRFICLKHDEHEKCISRHTRLHEGGINGNNSFKKS